MASSLEARDLGKYSEVKESSNGNGRPHERSRALDSEEVNIIRICSGSGCVKQMRNVKSALVCSCKEAIHCSKDCFKSSNHKCLNETGTSNTRMPNGPRHVEFGEVVEACFQRHVIDRKTNRGPSSDQIMRLKKMTRGDHKRILKYAEKGNPTAAYIVGSAYMRREFNRGEDFAIPLKDKEISIIETDEVAIRWLKMAAEGGVPEAMFDLFLILTKGGNLQVDQRVADYWLAQAHATGKMEYVGQILKTPNGPNFPAEFASIYDANIQGGHTVLGGHTLAHLLMATRFRELKAWGGKTALGETFYGWDQFGSIMESIGELKKDRSMPSLIDGEKNTLLVINNRPGYSDVVSKLVSIKREENNLKFIQGTKEELSPDYQLMGQTSNMDARTSYLISCKHDEVKFEEKFKQIKYEENGFVTYSLAENNKSLVDFSKSYTSAGKCESCIKEAKQRLRAVSLGQFSISITPVHSRELYTARYANEDGVIVQDVFESYSKPCMRQALQCLMSNPADLHPLVIAEETHLFWPITWFWGSVFKAVQDTCTKATLDAIYHSLGDEVKFSESQNTSAMAAFPEAAAGEWRIACGNDDCPRVDHEVKFNLCKGCKVRRYCDVACQKEDWPKHINYCKAVKKNLSGED